MGLLSSGQAMLYRVMAAEGQPITYSRRSTTLSMTAMPDDSQELVDNGQSGQFVQTIERTFAINLTDLGTLQPPQDGDMILWRGEKYRVSADVANRCFDWLDNRQLRLAVLTKRVK